MYWCFFLPITCLYLSAQKAVLVLSVSAKKGASIDVAGLAILYHAYLCLNVVFFNDFCDNSHTDRADDESQAE